MKQVTFISNNRLFDLNRVLSFYANRTKITLRSVFLSQPAWMKSATMRTSKSRCDSKDAVNAK